MIRLDDVSKAYARTGLALDNVSVHVAKGEFVFLTGPAAPARARCSR